MCRVMEEVRAEGREEGREENRNQMIAILMMDNTENDLLYDKRFKGLHITQAEIDAAKEQALTLDTEE